MKREVSYIKLKKSMSVSLCGLLGALMIVAMLLGNILPLTSALCPAIAGFFLIPALRECGFSYALILFLAVGILSLLLLPNKESALLFSLLLGLYPLCRPALNRITLRPLQLASKLLFFNLLLFTIYALLLFILAPAALFAEFSTYTGATLLLLLLMGNAAFFLYDTCLNRITFLYEYKLRAKLFRF